jgi:uncharacterized protein
VRDQAPQSIAAAEVSNDEPLAKTLLALNNTYAQELSWLEPARLEHMVGQAFLARRIGDLDALRRIGDLDAFLLAFDQGADYDSPNFLWFRARIVVAASARRRGCARRLYRSLFEHAATAGHERVVCEVNINPPNPASDTFHAALGFVEVGSASVHEGSKTVRYLSRSLTSRP